MIPADVLAAYGPAAGLAGTIAPWPRHESLAEAFAANPLLMAPMAGVSDAAYRMMARAGGAALAYTEMVSVAGIHYRSSKTWELVIPDDGEPDIAVQLFGSKPEQFEEAAAAVAERLGGKLALIDVNMACPVPKVCRKGEGSALLDEPGRAGDIIRACIAGAGEKLPVTAKIRIGRTPNALVGPEFARELEAAGAAAVAVHGRFASQMYRGQADWEAVSQVAAAVSIPVIGSGDVLDAPTAARMLRETPVSAIFVARGTYGNPWLFSDAQHILEGSAAPEHSLSERMAALGCHVRLLEATHAHIARARSLAAWYLKGIPDAAAWRNRAMACVTASDFLELIEEVPRDG